MEQYFLNNISIQLYYFMGNSHSVTNFNINPSDIELYKKELIGSDMKTKMRFAQAIFKKNPDTLESLHSFAYVGITWPNTKISGGHKFQDSIKLPYEKLIGQVDAFCKKAQDALKYNKLTEEIDGLYKRCLDYEFMYKGKKNSKTTEISSNQVQKSDRKITKMIKNVKNKGLENDKTKMDDKLEIIKTIKTKLVDMKIAILVPVAQLALKKMLDEIANGGTANSSGKISFGMTEYWTLLELINGARLNSTQARVGYEAIISEFKKQFIIKAASILQNKVLTLIPNKVLDLESKEQMAGLSAIASSIEFLESSNMQISGPIRAPLVDLRKMISKLIGPVLASKALGLSEKVLLLGNLDKVESNNDKKKLRDFVTSLTAIAAFDPSAIKLTEDINEVDLYSKLPYLAEYKQLKDITLSLLRVFENDITLFDKYVHNLLSYEAKKTKDITTLFRENTPASKVISAVIKSDHKSQEYAKTQVEWCSNNFSLGKGYEIDAEKLKERMIKDNPTLDATLALSKAKGEVAVNLPNLKKMFMKFITQLCDVATVPNNLALIAYHMFEGTAVGLRKKAKKSQNAPLTDDEMESCLISVGNPIMLRHICPKLSGPAQDFGNQDDYKELGAAYFHISKLAVKVANFIDPKFVGSKDRGIYKEFQNEVAEGQNLMKKFFFNLVKKGEKLSKEAQPLSKEGDIVDLDGLGKFKLGQKTSSGNEKYDSLVEAIMLASNSTKAFSDVSKAVKESVNNSKGDEREFAIYLTLINIVNPIMVNNYRVYFVGTNRKIIEENTYNKLKGNKTAIVVHEAGNLKFQPLIKQI